VVSQSAIFEGAFLELADTVRAQVCEFWRNCLAIFQTLNAEFLRRLTANTRKYRRAALVSDEDYGTPSLCVVSSQDSIAVRSWVATKKSC
jgi:hypothetical protein